MKKIGLYLIIIFLCFIFANCTEKSIDNKVIKSKQLERIISNHIKEIGYNYVTPCNIDSYFVSIAFFKKQEEERLEISTHSLEPIYQMHLSNLKYNGVFTFEGRNIVIFDQDSIGYKFYNCNKLCKDSMQSFEDKKCQEEIMVNIESYRINNDKLELLQKRIIPNIKSLH